ncbi:hypothetical protein ACFX10_035642 [Malus domestica]
MRRIDLFVQFVGTELLLMCIESPGELRMAGVCQLLMPDQSITTIRKVMD